MRKLFILMVLGLLLMMTRETTIVVAGEITIVVPPTESESSEIYKEFALKFKKAIAEKLLKVHPLGNYSFYILERWGVLKKERGAYFIRNWGKMREKPSVRIIGLTINVDDNAPLWFFLTDDLKESSKRQSSASEAAETTIRILKDFEREELKKTKKIIM